MLVRLTGVLTGVLFRLIGVLTGVLIRLTRVLRGIMSSAVSRDLKQCHEVISLISSHT